MVMFGFMLHSVSEHSYFLTALNKLFLARTSSPSLFKKTKKGKKHTLPDKFNNSNMKKEVEMHYIISLSLFKSVKLFVLSRFCNCWRKNSETSKLLLLY